MSNAKHTPIPWRIERQSNGLYAVCADLAKRHGGSTPFSLATDIRVANAEFIVRACNSHADLLEALQRLEVASPGDLEDPESPAWVFARAAIAKAGGKSTMDEASESRRQLRAEVGEDEHDWE